MEEKQLIRLAKKGDQDAFEELMTVNAQYVYNLALRVVKDPQEAQDISQEAFIRVWKALPGFKGKSSFRTWLYRIVSNLCYDRLPKMRKEFDALDPDEEIDLVDDGDRPEKKALSGELRSELHHAIDALPESYRLLITLRHLQNMTYDEIAESTGQPLGTVKTGIFRARRLLYDKMVVYDERN